MLKTAVNYGVVKRERSQRFRDLLRRKYKILISRFSSFTKSTVDVEIPATEDTLMENTEVVRAFST